MVLEMTTQDSIIYNAHNVLSSRYSTELKSSGFIHWEVFILQVQHSLISLLASHQPNMSLLIRFMQSQWKVSAVSR